MGKDPAVLWYWNDWQGGTMTMTRHLKGCYMDLLNAQFNSGHLSLDDIKTVLGSDFGSSWPALQKKFQRDKDGNFFNERLKIERDKRSAYSESRAGNRKKKPNISISYVPHMENENENENLKKEGVEEKLKRLDDIYIEQQRMKWKHIDFELEYRSFLEKVRGSPEVYADHQDLRLAFQAQLRNAKRLPPNAKSANITDQQRDEFIRKRAGLA